MASRHAERAKNTYWTEENFKRVEVLNSLADELGCETTQLVIAWTLTRQAVTSVIVGSSRPGQIAKNSEASGITLPVEVIERLEQL